MVVYAPTINYGTGSIRYSSTPSSITTMAMGGYGIDYATGDSVTNCYLRVKYTRGIDDGWAVVGENNGTCGIPWITTGASTTATTIKFHTWGEPHVEVEAEWRGIYNPQSGWVQYEPKPKTMACGNSLRC